MWHFKFSNYFNTDPLSSACAPGTLGTHCQYRCRYPAYGLGCQMTCDCNESQCDAKMGCEHLKNGEYIIR